MKRHLLTLAAALLSPTLAHAQATQPSPAVKPIAPSKIILVGDSTTAVFGGWGPSFCAYHVTSFMACVNLARGGRSSRTYMQERSWDIALGEAKVPGYKHVWVLIQFGHNDQPGNSRSTELAQERGRHLSIVQSQLGEPFAGTVLQRGKDGACCW